MKFTKPHNKTKKESRRSKKKLILVIGLLLVLFSLFIWVMRQKRFAVTNINVNGTQTILDIDITNLTTSILNQKILFVLPKSNMFILNTSHIEKKIKNTFPKIYDARVYLKKNKTLSINIEEREPHSMWCLNDEYESDFDEVCYFADQRGYIYARAPYFSEGVFEKIYTNQDLVIGTQVMDKLAFKDFFAFVNLLNEKYGIHMDRVFFDQDKQVRIYINKILTKDLLQKPYIVYHYDDSNYEILARNIGLMLGQIDFKKELDENAERLEFIDIRIDDQIRYKFTPIGYVKPEPEIDIETEIETKTEPEISLKTVSE